SGLLFAYEVDKKSYWIVTGWKEHQRIDKPNYRYPLPETLDGRKNSRLVYPDSANNHLAFGEQSQNSLRIGDEHSTTEWNGKEWKGIDKNICEVAVAPSPVSVVENDSTVNTIRNNPDMLDIFSHWQKIMRHPQAKLDKKRSRKIMQALKLGYTVAQL